MQDRKIEQKKGVHVALACFFSALKPAESAISATISGTLDGRGGGLADVGRWTRDGK